MQIPFNKNLYLKTLAAVATLTAVFFIMGTVFFGYEPTTADPFCAPVAAALLAYLLHLAFWKPE